MGWISHLYYWIYPGIMVAFTATLFGYLYSALVHHTLTWLPISLVAVGFAMLVGYIGSAVITNTDPSSNHLIGGYAAAANAKGTSARSAT